MINGYSIPSFWNWGTKLDQEEILSLIFTLNGRFLISGSSTGNICVSFYQIIENM